MKKEMCYEEEIEYVDDETLEIVDINRLKIRIRLLTNGRECEKCFHN